MIDYRIGDSREVTAGIPDGSVDLIASSPPFLALRSYLPADHASKGSEIGSEANPAAFIDTLLALTAEWGRVLAPHGSIAIELGDTYSGSGGAGGDHTAGGLREGQPGFTGSALRSRKAQPVENALYTENDLPPRNGRRNRPADVASGILAPTSRPGPEGRDKIPGWPLAKSLALIPQLYAVALAYGINPLTGQPSPAGRWLVRNVIVWHRPNPAVGALGDKVRPSTSYIVIATRSPKRWFDLTAVRTPFANAFDRRDAELGGRAYSGNANRSEAAGNNKHIGLQDRLQTHAGAPPLDCWMDHYDGTHDTWTLTTQPSRLAHYAMWPAKLAERLILMMCPLAVCTVCGEPRRRVETATRRNPANDGTRLLNHSAANPHSGFTAPAPEIGWEYDRETTGWTHCGCGFAHDFHCKHNPCVCERNYRPGLTLDPFAGSGTTLAVADLHGRDAIGIDFDARNKAIYSARFDEVKRALYGTPAPMPGQMELAL